LEADRSEFIKPDILVDPKRPEPRYFREFLIYREGGSEYCIKCLMRYKDIKTSLPLKDPMEEAKVLRTYLKGSAYAQFEYHLRKRLGAKNVQIPDTDLLEIFIEDVGL
jgi:hypothetical protein